jgi:hypothetical protein
MPKKNIYKGSRFKNILSVYISKRHPIRKKKKVTCQTKEQRIRWKSIACNNSTAWPSLMTLYLCHTLTKHKLLNNIKQRQFTVYIDVARDVKFSTLNSLNPSVATTWPYQCMTTKLNNAIIEMLTINKGNIQKLRCCQLYQKTVTCAHGCHGTDDQRKGFQKFHKRYWIIRTHMSMSKKSNNIKLAKNSTT